MLSVSILGLGGVSAYQYYLQSQLEIPQDDSFDYQFLGDDDRLLLQVLIPVFVSDGEKFVPLNQIVQNIDSAIVLLSLKTQVELRELFELLASIFGRLTVANVWLDWQSASSESIDQFLTEWRESSLELLQTAYKGLHKLVVGSVYAEQSIWQEIGYPGPISIGATQV